MNANKFANHERDFHCRNSILFLWRSFTFHSSRNDNEEFYRVWDRILHDWLEVTKISFFALFSFKSTPHKHVKFGEGIRRKWRESPDVIQIIKAKMMIHSEIREEKFRNYSPAEMSKINLNQRFFRLIRRKLRIFYGEWGKSTFFRCFE